MEHFKRKFEELDREAENLNLDFIAAFKVKGDDGGTMAITGESSVFKAAFTLIDSDNATIEELAQVASAISARIAELEASPHQNNDMDY